MHDPADPGRITIPRDGLYEVGAGVSWTNSDDDGDRVFSVFRDGVEPGDDRSLGYSVANSTGTGGFQPVQTGSILWRARAGDKFEIIVNQTSGSTLSAVASHFTARYVGPIS